MEANTFAELYNTPGLNLLEGERMEELEDKLAKFFGRKERVKVAYLFGSAAKGEVGELSDVDVAVYLDDSLTDEERFKLRLELMSELASLFGTDKMDLVVMNDNPLLLNYNVIKHGKLVKSDERTRVRMETKILSRYLDMKHYIDRHTRLSIERMAEKGLS